MTKDLREERRKRRRIRKRTEAFIRLICWQCRNVRVARLRSARLDTTRNHLQPLRFEVSATENGDNLCAFVEHWIDRLCGVAAYIYAYPTKNLRSYREMLGARYDHRLLLLVLPATLSFAPANASLSPSSFCHSTRIYLDRRNMPAACSLPFDKTP